MQAPRGELVVTAPVLLGQRVMAEFVTRFMAAKPRIRFSVQLLDRFVDLVDEGVDVGIRIGAVDYSPLVALNLGDVRQVVVASPAFLHRTGTPRHPSDLRTWPCIRLDAPVRPGWSFQDAGCKLPARSTGRSTLDRSLANTPAIPASRTKAPLASTASGSS